jgi:outer membrane protein OmpA-like peptidoglycan-associated protein
MPPPALPEATPSPGGPSPGGKHKTYMSGLDTGPAAAPPAPPAAPDASAAPSGAMGAEAVTPPAQGSAELDQIYASKLQESAPTVTTAPVGPTSTVAGANTAAIAEPAEKPAKGKHGKSSKVKGSGAPSPSSNPSVQVFDSGYDGGYAGTYQAAYNDGNDGYDGGAMLPGQVGTIYFASGSTQIGESDRAKLSQVVAQYRERGGMIRIVGHASSFTRDMDPTQHDSVNYSISSRRADAVAKALMKLGIGAENITTAAEADHDPVYYEVMPAGEAGNRRAEIFIDY